MARYEVKWEMTEEDVDSVQDAVDASYNRLMSHKNDWIWTVTDLDTGKVYDVDYDTYDENNPVITEVDEKK